MEEGMEGNTERELLAGVNDDIRFIDKMERNITREKLFIEELATDGNVTRSAKAAGLKVGVVYDLRKRVPEFAKAWGDAERIGAQALEDEARRRAFDGWDVPVQYRDGTHGVVRKYSDALLMFLLKGLIPERYKDRYEMKAITEMHFLDSNLQCLSDDELKQLSTIMSKVRKTQKEGAIDVTAGTQSQPVTEPAPSSERGQGDDTEGRP